MIEKLSGKEFLHGSKVNELTQLKVEMSSPDSPFGAAIYFTEDPHVAGCYSRNDGSIYNALLVGHPLFTINLDKKIGEQTAEAMKSIIHLNRMLYKQANIHLNMNARDAIHRVYEIKNEANKILRAQGIWLLYGQLSGMECSGLMDRGVQYAVIDNSSIEITGIYE